MKGYFFLLAFLCLAKTIISLWGLFTPTHALIVISQLGDIVLFPLCAVGCYGLAFKKVIWTLPRWTIIRSLTLAMGVYAVVVYAYGERFGIPAIGNPGLLTISLIFLPYLLAAIPIILYEHAFKTGFEKKDE